MRFRTWILIIILLSAGVAASVATILTQKQRLQPMSPAERRQYLADKMGSRLSDDQIDKIAQAISSRLDGAAAAEAEAAPEGGSDEAPES